MKYLYFSAALIFSLLAVGCASAPPVPVYQEGFDHTEAVIPGGSPVYEVPFRYGPDGQEILVDLLLDGQTQSVPFLLDTGCSISMVDQSVAARLPVRDFSFRIPIQDADRNIRLTYPQYMDSVRFGGGADGGPVVRNGLFTIQDLGGLKAAGFKGILGINWLKPFQFTIDNARKVLSLRLDNKPLPPSPDLIQFTSTPSIQIPAQVTVPPEIAFIRDLTVEMPLTINGVGYKVLLDTGNQGTLLMPEGSIAETHVPAAEVLDLPEPAMQGLYGGISSEKLVRYPDIRFGHTKADYLVGIASRYGLPNLGQGFLKYFNITVDFYNQTVALHWNGKGPVQTNLFQFGFHWEKSSVGARVTALDIGYGGGQAGLRQGDLIVKAGGQTGEAVPGILKSAESKPEVTTLVLTVVRNGTEVPVEVKKKWQFPPLDRADQSSEVTFDQP